ncbi:protein SULFUR DEFICIENCY-INDUCED 1 isoform X3 [Elaeis guineensis]|uniref:protein SULFUR DEFICIENCY-INDUCED 1 isoform X3 n=1 Tax=Elaeis guineensis var. tenera TaxID=51953 RepID=UPI003C6DA52D
MEAEKRRGGGEKEDMSHVIHKVPAGDSPYGRAKHLQLVEKDPEMAIVWFWKAINAGDRVDSALKDMAVVMKQQDRAEEAVEAIKSFRHLCSKQAQVSLDNLLIDLYKGNLGWAYMQQNNYDAAEVVYRKAQMIEPDANKACNLGLCLIKKGRFDEARAVLEEVLHRRYPSSDDGKIISRAEQLVREIELQPAVSPLEVGLSIKEEIMERLDLVMNEWAPFRSKRLPIFEEISTWRDHIAC